MPRHIVAACFNKAQVTRRFLESFRRNSRHPWELIFVDNASSDDTPQVLEEFRAQGLPLTVFRNEKNLGCAGAWNIGVREALARGSQLVGVLNNDIVFGPDWDTGLLGYLETHPEEAIVGPHTMKCALKNFDEQARHFALRNECRTRRKLVSESMFMRAEVFTRVGFFDERFFLTFEDTDFYVRAVQAGIHPVVTGASVLWHQELTTRGTMPRDYEEKARQLFSEKWNGLGILKASGWERPRWKMRLWRWRERFGIL